MKLLVEIDKEEYQEILINKGVPYHLSHSIGDAILNGTPLPEHHGDLIDRNKLIEQYGLENATKYGNKNAEQQRYSYSTMMMYEIADMIDDAETIIPAAKEGDAE